MEDVSQSVFLYDIRKDPRRSKRLAEICVALLRRSRPRSISSKHGKTPRKS